MYHVTIPKTANCVSLHHSFLKIYEIITGSFVKPPLYEIKASITIDVVKEGIIHLSSKRVMTTVKK